MTAKSLLPAVWLHNLKYKLWLLLFENHIQVGLIIMFAHTKFHFQYVNRDERQLRKKPEKISSVNKKLLQMMFYIILTIQDSICRKMYVSLIKRSIIKYSHVQSIFAIADSSKQWYAFATKKKYRSFLCRSWSLLWHK